MEEQNTNIGNNEVEAAEAKRCNDTSKPAKKTINKQTMLVIILGVIVAILAIVLTTVLLGGNNQGNAPTNDSAKKIDEKYNLALTLIQTGDYTDAYEILKNLGDYKDAKEKLEKFQFIPINCVTTGKQNGIVIDGYTMGLNISYNKHNLPQCVETYESLVGYGELDYSREETTEYIYNENGQIINKTHKDYDGDKYMYEYTYDSRKNIIREVYTDSNTGQTVTTYTYDIDNNLVKEVIAQSGGQKWIREYTYDTNGHLLRKAYTSISEYNVSNTGSTYDYTYDEYGNLIKESSPNHTIDYTYDQSGNLIKKVVINSSANSSNDHTINYTYDQNGNLIKEVKTRANSGDTVIVYEYSESGKLIKRTTDETTVEKYSYDQNGNLIEFICSRFDTSITLHEEQIYNITYSLVYIEFESAEYQKLLDEVIPIDFY